MSVIWAMIFITIEVFGGAACIDEAIMSYKRSKYFTMGLYIMGCVVMIIAILLVAIKQIL